MLQKRLFASTENTLVTAPAKISDLWTATSSFKYYRSIFPDFHYCIVSKGWYYKSCLNSPQCLTGNKPFVNTLRNFEYYPTQWVEKHLNSERHLDTAKTKPTFREMSSRRTNVWKLFKKVNYAQIVKNTSTNRYVINWYFRVIHLVIIQK